MPNQKNVSEIEEKGKGCYNHRYACGRRVGNRPKKVKGAIRHCKKEVS